MLGVKAGDTVVAVGDTVYYRAGPTLVPAEVIDVADGAQNTLNLRVGERVIKGVGHDRTKFGSWRVEKR